MDNLLHLCNRQDAEEARADQLSVTALCGVECEPVVPLEKKPYCGRCIWFSHVIKYYPGCREDAVSIVSIDFYPASAWGNDSPTDELS